MKVSEPLENLGNKIKNIFYPCFHIYLYKRLFLICANQLHGLDNEPIACEIQLSFPIEQYWKILETFMIETQDHGRMDDDLAANGMSLSKVSFGLCIRGIFGYTFRLPFCHNKPPRWDLNPDKMNEVDISEWEVVTDTTFDFEEECQYLWEQ